jgi:hypothetical protein
MQVAACILNVPCCMLLAADSCQSIRAMEINGAVVSSQKVQPNVAHMRHVV